MITSFLSKAFFLSVPKDLSKRCTDIVLLYIEDSYRSSEGLQVYNTAFPDYFYILEIVAAPLTSRSSLIEGEGKVVK